MLNGYGEKNNDKLPRLTPWKLTSNTSTISVRNTANEVVCFVGFNPMCSERKALAIKKAQMICDIANGV